MNDSTHALRLRQLLVALILALTFEGILRKAFPQFSTPLFLLKDGIVTIMAFYVLRIPPSPAISFLWTAYKTLVVLFVPLIICTAWNDPVLAVFGAKQYLLFPVVGFATFYAFERSKVEQILGFFRWVSLLVIPTALLAFVQLRLPHDHWLNMSVNGDTLEAFSAGGELRVSSTFSFVAQYCTFLNAQAFIVIIALYDWRNRKFLWKIILLALIPFLVFSSFITGSRGAVAGDTAIILLAAGLSLVKLRVRNILQISAIMVGLYLATYAVNHFFPKSTAAYSERENGRLIGISGDIQQRVLGSYTIFTSDRSLTTFFGNGLGVMSGGSDSFSSYAAKWRAYKWAETDFASTLFEGGYYLVIVWYGFRFYVVFVTTSRFLKEVEGAYFVPAAFTQSFVMIIGALGTLAIQPPIAIWWWLGVGTSLLFWWKCVGPTELESEQQNNLPPPKKIVRGRSLYAEVLHSRK